MLYVYIVISALLIPILNNFFDILQKSYSWWLVPILLLLFFIGFVIIHCVVFLFLILIEGLYKKEYKITRLFRFLAKSVIKIVLFLAGVKVNSKGLEKLPDNNKRMLFISNHLHDCDPVIILSQFPDSDIAFIGKKDILTQMPFVAKIMRCLQCLFIDRENDREAAKTIIKAIRNITDNKTSIGLFPEGYVSKSGELLPFRNGSLKIAIKAKCPIVVCVLDNTSAIYKNMFRRRTNVSFQLVDVIMTEQYENLNTSQLGDMLHEKMEASIKSIREKQI